MHAKAQFSFVPLPMGLVNKLLVKNDTIYLAADSRAVYTSGNNGVSWSRTISSAFGTGTVNTIHFLKNGNLAAGTATNGIKIWNGTSWTATNNGFPVFTGGLLPFITAVTDDALGIMYASSRLFGPAAGGVYMYNGTAWTTITSNLPDNNVNALITGPGGTLYAGTDAGIYFYNGSTWTSFNNGIPLQKIYCLEFDATGNMFAGGRNGLYKLPLGNTSWTNISAGLPSTLAVLSIAFHPSDPNRMYTGLGFMRHDIGALTGDVYTSADGGISWTEAFSNVQTARVAAIAVLPNGNALAGARGVFSSSDNGSNWAPSSAGLDFSAGTTYASKIMITPAGKIFLGTDNGIFSSTDNGASWQQSFTGLKSSYISAINYNGASGYIYASGRSQIDNAQTSPRMYRSINNGTSWDTLPGPLDRIYNNFGFKGPDTIYMAHGFGSIPPTGITGSVITASYNKGNSFNDINITGGAVGLAFSMGVKSNGDIFVGSETQNVCRSTDGGNTFAVNLLGNNSGNTSVMLAPNGDIWSSSNTQFALYYSTAANSGNSFINFNAGNFPQFKAANALAFDNTGNTYVAVNGPSPGNPSLYKLVPPFTPSSVFQSTGLNSVTLRDLAWHPCGKLWGIGPGTLVVSNAQLTAASGTCSSLPLQLISFSGKAQPSFNLLSWSVSGETGIASYEVQSSVNNIDFLTKATIAAINSSVVHNYDFKDHVLQPGVQYYRLRIIKQDGSDSYSTIVKISGMLLKELVVYPNPSQEYLNILFRGLLPADISLMEIQTGLIKKFFISRPATTVSIKGLAQGTYLLTVKDRYGAAIGYEKVIIQ